MSSIQEARKCARYCLLMLLLCLGIALPGCGRCRDTESRPAEAADLSKTEETGPDPAYFRPGLLPIQKMRWDSIPPNRHSEFSFGTRLYPAQEPDDPDSGRPEIWRNEAPGLQGSFASVEKKYPRSAPPGIETSRRIKLSGWKGERIYSQLLLWSSSEISQVRWKTSSFAGGGMELPAGDCLKVNFVRYVLADDGSQEGRGAPPDQRSLMPDVLEDFDRFDLPARSVRPLWISVQIPQEAEAGEYRADITVEAENAESLTFTIELEVLPRTLPPPSEWSFQLDLWQNPWAVARYHHVRPWSPEHWSLLKPLTQMLAQAGQKCITTTIVSRPWGGQTLDAYESMVEWTRLNDGTWRYDYSVFDRYVEFCMEQGIKEQINCFTVLSWSGYSYFDEQSAEYKTLSCAVGSPEYREHWRPFLSDFARHLKEKGWFERTVFGIDEAPLEQMRKIIDFLRADAPELKIGLTGEYLAEINDDVYHWCFFIDQQVSAEVLRERRSLHRPSTFYVCCGPALPNTFTFSPPVEAAWLGWYAAARGFDGFLRWAYNSWPLDPLVDSRYISWPAGDCFLVYPGPRSSIRFERLREGVQDYEKIRLLKEELAKTALTSDREKLEKLTAFLMAISYSSSAGPDYYLNTVNQGKALLEELSR